MSITGRDGMQRGEASLSCHLEHYGESLDPDFDQAGQSWLKTCSICLFRSDPECSLLRTVFRNSSGCHCGGRHRHAATRSYPGAVAEALARVRRIVVWDPSNLSGSLCVAALANTRVHTGVVEGSHQCCWIPRCCLGLVTQAHCYTDLAQPWSGLLVVATSMAPKRHHGPPTPYISRVLSALCTQLRCS